MKSAKQFAEETFNECQHESQGCCRDCWIKALTAYADERVKEATSNVLDLRNHNAIVNMKEKQIEQARSEGYAQAIEDAAKLFESDNGRPLRLRHMIRALVPKK